MDRQTAIDALEAAGFTKAQYAESTWTRKGRGGNLPDVVYLTHFSASVSASVSFEELLALLKGGQP